MKLKLLLLTLLFLPLALSAQRFKSNIAVGITKKTDTTVVHRVNVGLLNHITHLRGAQLGIASAVVRNDMKGVNLGGLFAGSGGNVNGVQIGGLGAVSAADMHGVQASALANYVGNNMYGFQTALAINVAAKEMRGMQLSAITNVAHYMRGVQIGGISNVVGPGYRGMQVTAVVNVANNVERGIQLAGAMNITEGRMNGLQFAPFNYADTLRGAQLGVLNIGVRHPRGAQIGVINIGGDTTAFRLGLVNIDTHTKVQMMAGVGTSTKLNLGVRFLNRRTYSFLGVGTHYLGLDKDFSGALYYRTGRHRQLSSRLRLTGDVGYAHVETFSNVQGEAGRRLYSLSGRIGLDYQRWEKFGFFIQAGFEHTRFYAHNRHYKSRPLLEVGIWAF